MKRIKVNRQLLSNMKQLKMNQVTKTTVTTPTEHYDYELITLVLNNNGAN